MGLVIANQVSEISNSSTILFVDAVVLTMPTSVPRFVWWTGNVWNDGPNAQGQDRRSQLELAMGAGTTYARSNVALAAPGWYPTGGYQLHVPINPFNDPLTIRARLRAYDPGHTARARDFKILGLDVDTSVVPYAYGFIRDNGTGTNTITTDHVQAGETKLARTATLSSVVPGSYIVGCSIEYQHNSLEDGVLALYRGDLKLIEAPLSSQGIFNHYGSHQFLRWDDSQNQSGTYNLFVQAPSNTTLTYRRPTILAVHESGL